MKDNKNNDPFHVIPIKGVNRNCRKQRSIWKFKEMLKYTFFLHDLVNDGKSSAQSALHKEDYKLMSRMITTRNVNQCRMFHLKMTHIFGNLEEILTFFRSNIELYQQYHHKYQEISQKQDNSTLTIPQTTHYQPSLATEPPTTQNKYSNPIHVDSLLANGFNLDGIKLLDAYGWIDEINAFIATFQHNWLEEQI